MICTDSVQMKRKLYEQMQRELARAIRAHGGKSYVFFTEEDPEKDGPLVNANGPVPRCFGPLYRVSRVEICELDGKEVCGVFGYALGDWDEEEDLDGLKLEDYQLIIEAIPATDTIKDVSEEEGGYVVLRMYAEDVEAAGYSIDEMSCKTLEKIAEAAGEGLKYDFLQGAIQAACYELKVDKLYRKPQKEEKKEEKKGEYPIIVLQREHIRSAGYDADALSESDLKRIAICIGEQVDINMFMDALKNECEFYAVPKLKT